MISIITSYFNRKQQFHLTLKSIAMSKFKDIEFIVVDDGSLPEHRLEDLLPEFSFMKIIRVEPKDKWYVNPSVPFNIGIRAAKGEIIVLQNPECLHVHDILSYFSKNVNDSNYIAISTYAMDEATSKKLPLLLAGDLVEYFKTLPQKFIGGAPWNGWYCHTKYRPEYFHFCAAMTKKNMDKLNGFDERFANGIACDDVEFVIRIDRLGLNKIICDDLSVIHQWHPPFYYSVPNAGKLRSDNGVLLNVVRTETAYRANNLTII